MALSKTTRIIILLAIDSAFFLLELIIGYSVHSLALVADSFHMLNDVLSLCVGLWAVKVANEKTNSKIYTYGWQRAETLGALINGVFLVALCLSIFLEAIQRIAQPEVVTNPLLVLIVGSCGLVSNLLGLVLFHDHGHSHGPSQGTENQGASPQRLNDDLHAAEVGRSRSGVVITVDDINATAASSSGPLTITQTNQSSTSNQRTERSSSLPVVSPTNSPHPKFHNGPSRQDQVQHNRNSRFSSGSRGYNSLEDIHVHPASLRQDIISAARISEDLDASSSESEEEYSREDSPYVTPSDDSPLIKKKRSSSRRKARGTSPGASNDGLPSHSDHKHSKSGGGGGHGHNHGDLNMRGVFLHVLGDALGNIGVIASALLIWLTKYSWRYYADPVISLLITVIILASAVPLCKAASRILLQAVPAGLNVDDIKADIQELPGIVSAHHLHVWQLSDTQLVASLHVQVKFDFKGEGSARYMKLARAIRKCLHAYGIHSSTIQPEFCLDEDMDPSNPDNLVGAGVDDDEAGTLAPGGGGRSASSSSVKRTISKHASRANSVKGDVNACLLECGEECENSQQCCASTPNQDA